MRLTELEPEWVNVSDHGHMRFLDSNSHQLVHYGVEELHEGEHSETQAQAQGVMFLCPVCFQRNGGAVGTEHVLLWFRDRGVPDAETPGPGRWLATGTGFEDLTLAPSVNVDHEHWHGFITNGEVT